MKKLGIWFHVEFFVHDPHYAWPTLVLFTFPPNSHRPHQIAISMCILTTNKRYFNGKLLMIIWHKLIFFHSFYCLSIHGECRTKSLIADMTSNETCVKKCACVCVCVCDQYFPGIFLRSMPSHKKYFAERYQNRWAQERNKIKMGT